MGAAVSTQASLKPRPGGGRPRWRPDWTRVLQALRDEVLAQGERWPLWTPVAFGIGAASYFAMKVEPSPLWAFAPASLVGVPTVWAHLWGRSRVLVIALILCTLGLCGFADGKLSTMLASAPVLPTSIGVVHVEGWVVDVASPSAGRARVLLAPVRISGLKRSELPTRVRLTLQSPDPPEPGQAVGAQAIMNPPPGPASPGAYDFARDAWFERVGGVGLALTEPRRLDLATPAWPLRLEMALNAFRWRMAERLTSDLQATIGAGPGRGLAAAVSTSHQNWLSPDEVSDLRNSGLAHMVAIAGLHTAAVTGFIFAALRLGIAAWPWLALRISGKKLAAFGGLLGAVAYLMISGAHPPARRAAITAGVAFIAILVDRRAISLRSLAIAALVILALQPVAVAEPGFQMSFCATAALVAMAELWPRRGGVIQAPWFLVWPQRITDWLMAMLAVSLVAGAATAPFAVQHFNRMASYGMFANLAADFVASAVLMPAVVVSALGETLGVDPAFLTPFLAVAGWSGQVILAIAHLFATMPGASSTIASAPWPALLVSFLGIVFGCLWSGRLRWIGVPLAAAVLLWPRPAPPIGWIAADGNNAAITVEGRAIVMKPAVQQFASSSWATRRGLTLPFSPDAEAELAFDCDRSHCAPRYGADLALGAWWSRKLPSPDKLEALCRVSDILILRAETTPPQDCTNALVLGPQAFRRGGAGEIFRNRNGGWRIDWSEPLRGRRPWTHASEGELSGSAE